MAAKRRLALSSARKVSWDLCRITSAESRAPLPRHQPLAPPWRNLFHVCSTSSEDMERLTILKTFFVPRVLRVPWSIRGCRRNVRCCARVYACARKGVEHVEHSSLQALDIEQTGNKTENDAERLIGQPSSSAIRDARARVRDTAPSPKLANSGQPGSCRPASIALAVS